MKIALCFFGQPRFINNLQSYNSHLVNFILPYDTDVFVHAWWSDSIKEYKVSRWSKAENIIVDKQTIKKIRKLYNPVHSVYEAPTEFSEDEDTSNIKSHLYSMKSVGLVLKEYTDPNDYDFIILSRFDNHILTFPTLEGLNDGFYKMEDHPGVADQLFVFSPRFLDFLNVYDNYDSIIGRYGYEGIEKVKLHHYEDKFREGMLSLPFTLKLIRS